ncbi:MAG: hypothetical protein FWH53_00050 [Leptospirales bacterium]|nr:hypothetical protein [Leptospirales bacterium]
MDRFTYSFSRWVWQHFPIRLQSLKASIIERFINAILLPFEFITNLANNLYDQIYADSCSEESLKKHGQQYGLKQKADETKEEFSHRFRIWRLIISAGGIKKSFKRALQNFTGVPEGKIKIIEGIQSLGAGPFIIGKSLLGTGSIVHSTQIFTFKVILPDLSHIQLNRAYIINELNEFSPSNEFTIIEKRGNYEYVWEEI